MTQLPSRTGDDMADYNAGFNAASAHIRAGDMEGALAINNAFGPVVYEKTPAGLVAVSPNLDWVAIGFRSAITIHFQAQGQRAGEALQ